MPTQSGSLSRENKSPPRPGDQAGSKWVKNKQIDLRIKSDNEYETAANVATRLTDAIIEYKQRSLPDEGRRRLMDRTREIGIGLQSAINLG